MVARRRRRARRARRVRQQCRRDRSATPAFPSSRRAPTSLDDAIDLNLRAVFFACQVEARSMIERGVGGSIINISSLGGVRTRAARLRLRRGQGGRDQPDADHGRRAWAPRHTDERHCPGDDGDGRGRCGGAIAVDASGGERQPRWVGSASPTTKRGRFSFLASDLSRYVNGQLISVDGGFSAAVGVVPRNRRAAAGIRAEGEGTADEIGPQGDDNVRQQAGLRRAKWRW